MIPLSLYIHLPWCIRKCPYCDFNSHEQKSDKLPEQNYVNILIQDLHNDLAFVQQRSIQSIFIGGGTPSLFSESAIKKLLSAISKHLNLTNNLEITLEANPGAVDQSRFSGYRDAGVNRISIGVQSFQNDKLKSLGRIHQMESAIAAVEYAKTAGFENFNIDLMYGLPSQTIEDAIYDLQTAVALNPPHLSWYQLTLEPNTLFHKQPPRLPADDLIWEMQLQGLAFLKSVGYEQYEVSAHSKPELYSRHNMNYWEFGDYLGIGAGAHSKLTDLTTGDVTRLIKIKHPQTYLSQTENFVIEKKIVAKQELPFEFMLNALRLYKPISFALFEQRTGLSLSTLEPMLLAAQAKEFINFDQNYLYVTNLGHRFLNDLMELFLAS